MLTLFGIAEVHQRQVLNRWLRGQSDQLRDQVAITGTPVGQVVEERRQKLDVAQRDIELLSFAGASGKDRTLDGIATALTETASRSGSGFETIANSASWTEYVFFFRYCNSDLLLSLIVMFSGIISATIAVMRSKTKAMSLLDVGIGMAVGPEYNPSSPVASRPY